ncbi:hypothetical protein KKB18_11610 [bacterium]|nr:hypothetical protein [bacterium]
MNAGHKNLIPRQKGQKPPVNAVKPKGPTLKGILSKLSKGQMTIKEGKKKIKKTRAEWLALQLFTEAFNEKNTAGEKIRAIETIMNRLEGKPEQPISAVKDSEVNITISGSETRI